MTIKNTVKQPDLEKAGPEHTYIALRHEAQGDAAVIAGTSVHVWAIVGYQQLGMSVEEIAKALPHLSLAQIYDALSYYHDHREEIDRVLERNRLSPEIDQETLIQRIMAVQGCSREDVERVLATQGAWADAPETEEAIQQFREEAAKWPIPEW